MPSAACCDDGGSAFALLSVCSLAAAVSQFFHGHRACLAAGSVPQASGRQLVHWVAVVGDKANTARMESARHNLARIGGKEMALGGQQMRRGGPTHAEDP